MFSAQSQKEDYKIPSRSNIWTTVLEYEISELVWRLMYWPIFRLLSSVSENDNTVTIDIERNNTR